MCLLNRFLSGASEAAASGADEAIAYDALPEENRAAAWDEVLATAMRCRSAAFPHRHDHRRPALRSFMVEPAGAGVPACLRGARPPPARGRGVSARRWPAWPSRCASRKPHPVPLQPAGTLPGGSAPDGENRGAGVHHAEHRHRSVRRAAHRLRHPELRHAQQ